MRIMVAVAALALGLTTLAAKPVLAQVDSREGIVLQNQLLQLRRDMQSLQQAFGSGSTLGTRPYPLTPPPSQGGASEIAAQLLNRVSVLEDQMRRLQGRIDEIDNARQRQYDDLAKQLGDLSFRMQNGGGGSSGPASQLSPGPSALGSVPVSPPTGSVPPAPLPRRTPELALQEGNAALARRDYPAAEAAAREALGGQRGPRSADAQFLLAQALSAQRNYSQAAIAYDDAYHRNTSGSHAADSLLGLAVSLNELGAKREACEALDTLRASFPTPRPELRDPIVSTRKRAACR